MRVLSSTRPALTAAALLALALTPGPALGFFAADFVTEARAATATLEPLRTELAPLLVEGRGEEANRRLLAIFPEKTRTPAQAFTLANMLYAFDPKTSYALHQQVAQKLPGEPVVQMEWAMEQHRAGEYAGALASYDAYSSTNPQYAPVHGLAADCLLHLGKIKEAAARWEQSEKATSGDLETFETLDCEIYKDLTPETQRADLLKKAQSGSVDAAVHLIALDGNFPRDWWNDGPHRQYLKSDLEVVKKLLPDPRIKAAQCVAECLLPQDLKAPALRKILLDYGYLIDPGKTLPADPLFLSLLLGSALESEVLTADQAREQLLPQIQDRARAGKDATLWNIVANLSMGTPAMKAVEKEAWDATGDVRFAGGYLTELALKKELKADDPLLAKAVKQFPEHSVILMLAVNATEKPDQTLLVQAIKAEYHHFSNGPSYSARPSALRLQYDFKQLSALLKQ